MELAIAGLTLALVIALALPFWRYRFGIDAGRVADNLAAQLLNDFQGDVGRLDIDGVRSHVSERYLQMVTGWGLPIGATDAIADMVWQRVKDVQGEPETVNPQSLYE